MKGRVSVIELMDRPFRELHEYYKIFLQRAEAQQKADEEAKKKAEEEERKKKSNKPFSNLPPQYNRLPTDVNNSSSTTMPEPSPMQAELLEEALEEIM